MTRHGEPIEDYPVAGAINPGIGYSMRFEEWQAGIAAGCDMWEWERGVYPPSFKAKVVAWYELRNAIELGVGDEKNKAMKRRSKNKHV